MKPDLYTKATLTIIATALVWIALRDSFPVVHAQSWQRVELVDGTGASLFAGAIQALGIPIRLESVGAGPVVPVELRTTYLPGQGIPVRVENPTLTTSIMGSVSVDASVSGNVTTQAPGAKTQHPAHGASDKPKK